MITLYTLSHITLFLIFTISAFGKLIYSLKTRSDYHLSFPYFCFSLISISVSYKYIDLFLGCVASIFFLLGAYLNKKGSVACNCYGIFSHELAYLHNFLRLAGICSAIFLTSFAIVYDYIDNTEIINSYYKTLALTLFLTIGFTTFRELKIKNFFSKVKYGGNAKMQIIKISENDYLGHTPDGNEIKVKDYVPRGHSSSFLIIDEECNQCHNLLQDFSRSKQEIRHLFTVILVSTSSFTYLHKFKSLIDKNGKFKKTIKLDSFPSLITIINSELYASVQVDKGPEAIKAGLLDKLIDNKI